MCKGREIASKGGPRQEFIIPNTTNIDDDPIVSVPGDVAINWVYANNGHRTVITGGHLSAENSNDDNTHGLGNNCHLNEKGHLQKHLFANTKSQISKTVANKNVRMQELEFKEPIMEVFSQVVVSMAIMLLMSQRMKRPFQHTLDCCLWTSTNEKSSNTF